jgi:hypothetical protein
MANPVPLPIAADATGLPDSQWITDVRDALRDYSQWQSDTKTGDGTNGVNAAGALPYILSRKPVNDGNDPLITVGGVSQTRDTANPPAASKYYINYDTGELFFNSAPGNGVAVNINYQPVKWRDSAILTGLYAGMRQMFPVCGKTHVDTSIQNQVNKWDYQLPFWAQDPRCQILKVEVIDPDIPTVPYQDGPNVVSWYRVGLNIIHIVNSQRYSPAARYRITAWGPYLSLGQVEPALYHLPIWYAVGTMMMKQEGVRVREDTMIPLTQEGARPPLTMAQLGGTYMKAFWDALGKMSRQPGPGWSKRLISYTQKRTAY